MASWFVNPESLLFITPIVIEGQVYSPFLLEITHIDN